MLNSDPVIRVQKNKVNKVFDNADDVYKIREI